MTMDELNNFRYLNKEIKTLQDQLDELNNNFLPSHDKISRPTMPSDPTRAWCLKHEALETRLKDKQTELVAEYNRIEDWLDQQTDSKIRLIVRCRFLKNQSWEEVAKTVYDGFCDPNTPRVQLTRYLGAE